MHQLFVVTLVCLLVAVSARTVAGGEGALAARDTGLGDKVAVRVPGHREKRGFNFRRYWLCPIGYIRSPAFMCVECEKYERLTGEACD